MLKNKFTEREVILREKNRTKKAVEKKEERYTLTFASGPLKKVPGFIKFPLFSALKTTDFSPFFSPPP
jgi:hypothetical protein